MKQSNIRFNIQLDDKNIPEKISWEATDNPHGGIEETKAIAISVWDDEQKNTMRIDLWNKDMRVDEMKLFCLETIAGVSETIKTSTGDTEMADKIKDLVKQLMTEIDKK